MKKKSKPKTASTPSTPKKRRPSPGRSWRVLSHGKGGVHLHNAGAFDELVVDEWLHLEQMDTRAWWMGIYTPTGPVHLWLRINKEGKAVVYLNEGHLREGKETFAPTIEGAP